MTDQQYQIETDVRSGGMRTAAGWHPEHVKAAIRAKGCTLTELGDRCGCEASTIGKAIRKPISRRLDRAIARFIGVAAHVIWPDRYEAPRSRARREVA